MRLAPRLSSAPSEATLLLVYPEALAPVELSGGMRRWRVVCRY